MATNHTHKGIHIMVLLKWYIKNVTTSNISLINDSLYLFTVLVKLYPAVMYMSLVHRSLNPSPAAGQCSQVWLYVSTDVVYFTALLQLPQQHMLKESTTKKNMNSSMENLATKWLKFKDCVSYILCWTC